MREKIERSEGEILRERERFYFVEDENYKNRRCDLMHFHESYSYGVVSNDVVFVWGVNLKRRRMIELCGTHMHRILFVGF